MKQTAKLMPGRLTSLRERRGLTIEQLAAELGLSPALVGRWEKGSDEPHATELAALSAYYGVSADYVVGASNQEEFYWQVPSDLTPQEIEFMKLCQSLEPELYGRFIMTVKTFVACDIEARAKKRRLAANARRKKSSPLPRSAEAEQSKAKQIKSNSQS